MKTHFNIFNDEYAETDYCGIYINDQHINISSDFEDVDCKKCIKLKYRAFEERKSLLESEIEFMSGFINFTENE